MARARETGIGDTTAVVGFPWGFWLVLGVWVSWG